MLALIFALANSIDPIGRLSVKNNKIVDELAQPAMLRGVGLSWHNWWSEFYTAEVVNWIKSTFHGTVTRAAIGCEQENGLFSNPDLAYNSLYTVVDASISAGIKVIVDFQTFQIHTSEAKDFFTKVATKYKGRSNVIYELFNEPESASWSQIKQYSIELINTIRAIDSSAFILVPTPNWDQYIEQAAADPIDAQNIAYTLHIYVATHPMSYLDNAKASLSKIPIFGTEIGAMSASGDGDLDVSKFNTWINFYEESKISYLAWGVQSKAESCSIVGTSGRLSDLTEWGKLFRDTITKYQ